MTGHVAIVMMVYAKELDHNNYCVNNKQCNTPLHPIAKVVDPLNEELTRSMLSLLVSITS